MAKTANTNVIKVETVFSCRPPRSYINIQCTMHEGTCQMPLKQTQIGFNLILGAKMI